LISVYFECEPDGREQLSAELYERGTLGILELPSGLRAWFDDVEQARDLIESRDGAVVEEPLTDVDWERRMQDSFPAIPIGKGFWLAPSWNTEPAPEGRMRLEITPGAACGTGWHECTQMCLEHLERFVTPGCRVLDVGTGSGILSVAARLLGAGRVISCDIDADVAPIARERLDSDTVYVGSVDAAGSQAFDVVVANISPEAVRQLEADLRRAVKPGGIIIASGFGDYPLDTPPRQIERRGEWLCSVL